MPQFSIFRVGGPLFFNFLPQFSQIFFPSHFLSFSLTMPIKQATFSELARKAMEKSRSVRYAAKRPRAGKLCTRRGMPELPPLDHNKTYIPTLKGIEESSENESDDESALSLSTTAEISLGYKTTKDIDIDDISEAQHY